MMPRFIAFLLLFSFELIFADFSFAGSTVRFYNKKGELSCVLPGHVMIELLGDSQWDNFVEVRLPRTYQHRCGAVGLVKRTSVQQDDLTEPLTKTSGDRSKTPQKISRWDLSLLPEPRKSKSTFESTDAEEAANSLEATGAEVCVRCQRPSEWEELVRLGSRSHEKVSRYQCEARGYQRSSSRSLRGQSIHDIIADYSDKAQGAIRRGFLSLVPPEGTHNYSKLKKLTHNFQDFESVDALELKRLLRKPEKDCYKFVKAALSNDYSRLNFYNQIRWGKSSKAANTKLVKNLCGAETGDLTDEYWLNAPVGAGTAGPELEKRGFINLMDSRFGVSHQYKSEKTAPEGAVLVYKCAKNGQILPSSQCYGDIAIKTQTGYLRDFFTPYEITRKGRRVLVGIYIKPGGPE